MSHRSRRSDDRDRDRSYKYDKYDKHEHRNHHRDYDDYDDSRDHRSRRSRHRSRSRSSSKSYLRHHRSRSRSRSSGHSHSRHHNEHHSRSHHHHRSKDHKDSPDSKSRHDSRDYYQSKQATASDSRVEKRSKCETTNEIHETDGPTSISTEQQNNQTYDAGTNEEPKTNSTAPNEEDSELEEEKRRVQRETMERLQKHFEKEGKAYPPPKPQASHPIFANDGSFLEIFKKTIQQQQSSSTMPATVLSPLTSVAAATVTAANEPQIKPIIAAAATATNPVIPMLPVKRRGAKILKTGIVQKQRVVEEAEEPQSTDSWSTYLKEVKRYKTVTCSDDNITRSLVK